MRVNDSVYDDTTQAFITLLDKIVNNCEPIVVRGSETKEFRNMTINVLMPRNRCYILPHRNDNIFAKIAETLWILAGRNDIKWLSYYLPRAPEWSDDGNTWRGGYGPRLRKWNGATYMADQLFEVSKLLKEDPHTRRAVISIWDPSEDMRPSKDIPCNNWLHFLIRNNKLHMNVVQRSCDILWGYSGIDTFSWTILQQMMAHWAGVDMGVYTHFISSLHLYDRHYKRAQKILDAYPGQSIYEFSHKLNKVNSGFSPPAFHTSLIGMDRALYLMFDIEYQVRKEANASVWRAVQSIPDAFLKECMNMIFLYSYIKQQNQNPIGATPDLVAYLSDMPDTDFKAAAVEYIVRKHPSNLGELGLSKDMVTCISKYLPK